jgi:exopolyphosphatase / guanosine-5'-triphosphate,3'-diphosphate pyrophosphatase
VTVRLAAIDVGSNSVHMVIADVTADGRIRVADRVKEMVRLGRQTFTTGELPKPAMALAVQTVAAFHRLAKARRVERVVAVATSAVREARNQTAFVRRLRRETGLSVGVISGEREARLIFKAVRHALGLETDAHLLIDIGGGSVELTLVERGKARWLRSFPLGVARLTERFFPNDPPRPAQVQRLERHLQRVLGTTLKAVRKAKVVGAIGTSGTINTMVTMAYAVHGREPLRLHGATVPSIDIHRVRQRILGVGPAKRAELVGMEAKRVDLMPAAAVLLDFILTGAGIDDLQACSWALREGVLLELAGVGGARAPSATIIRRRSVQELAARFGAQPTHGRAVQRLVARLFDGLAEPLGLPRATRELLEYAALLHDVGDAVDHDRHHQHSSYLIRNAELLHFEPDEIELIAQVVRAHRKQVPKSNAPELQALPTAERGYVRRLAALLRIADALDRTHSGVVIDLRVRVAPCRPARPRPTSSCGRRLGARTG